MFQIIAGLHQKREIIFLVKLKEIYGKYIGKDITKKERSLLPEYTFHIFLEQYKEETQALKVIENYFVLLEKAKNQFDINEIYSVLQSVESIEYSEAELILLSQYKEDIIIQLALKQFFLENPLYFQVNWEKNMIHITPKQKVQEHFLLLEEEKKEQIQIQEKKSVFIQYIKDFLDKIKYPLPDIIADDIKILKDFVIFEDRYQNKEKAQEIFALVGEHFPQLFKHKGNIYYEVFKLLNMLNIFDEDENLLLYRYSIAKEFPNTIEEEIKNCYQQHLILMDNRKDLRNLFTFTIDGEDTQDFDDALSFESLENRLILYIHISDVASLIKIGSELDKIAKERYRTLYFVDENINILPEALSQDILALRENKNSLAFTYKIEFSVSFELQNYEIFESIISVDKNYSYKEIDSILANHQNTTHKLSFIKDLFQIAKHLQKKRIEEGKGIDILFPKVSPYLKDSKLVLKIYHPQDNSAFLIKEFMILANFLSALSVYNKRIPMIYLSQERVEEAEDIPILNRYITEKEDFYKISKYLKKSDMTVYNQGHFALGVSHYTQITSPIRRYIDLVNQRQLKTALSGRVSLYSENDLMDLITYYKQKKQQSNHIENDRNKYYLLKYLYLYKDKPLEGTIIKILSDKDCLVELKETQIIAKVKLKSFKEKLWISVQVKIHTVYPRIGLTLGNII